MEWIMLYCVFVEVVFDLNIVHDVNTGRRNMLETCRREQRTPFAFYTSAEMNIAICRVTSPSPWGVRQMGFKQNLCVRGLMPSVILLREEKGRTGWISGNALDLLSGGSQFESRLKHSTVLTDSSWVSFFLENANSSSRLWPPSKQMPDCYSTVVPWTLCATFPCYTPVYVTPFCSNTLMPIYITS